MTNCSVNHERLAWDAVREDVVRTVTLVMDNDQGYSELLRAAARAAIHGYDGECGAADYAGDPRGYFWTARAGEGVVSALHDWLDEVRSLAPRGASSLSMALTILGDLLDLGDSEIGAKLGAHFAPDSDELVAPCDHVGTGDTADACGHCDGYGWVWVGGGGGGDD